MTIQDDVQRRGKARTRVLLTGGILSAAGSQKVLVRDLSREGAKICADGLADGDACFALGPLFVAARVAWRRKGVVGLKFYRPLSASELEAAFPSALSQSSDCGADNLIAKQG